MLPPAPARFSITTAWPSAVESRSPTRRAKMSVDPPGAKGTTRRMGLDGYFSCPKTASTTTKKLAMPRIQRIAKSVPEEVEGKNEQENRQARPERHPRRLVDVVLGGVQHAAPARRRRLLAQAEEREARFGDHR